MTDYEKKILGGLALAALVATGAGAAGVGPLAGVMSGASGGAAAGAAGAEAGLGMTEAELAALEGGYGSGAAATGALEGAGAAGTGMTEAELTALEGGYGSGTAGSLGGAAGGQPAAGALGEGAGAPLGSQASKAPLDFSKLLTKAGDQATNAAIVASVGQALQPTVKTTAYGQTGFQPYQPIQPLGMRMTSPEEQLRRLGFS